MRKLLTVKTLDALHRKERTEVYDTVLPGFGVVVQPSGRRVFFVRYRWRGKQPRYNLGIYPAVTLEEARQAAGEILRKVERGIDPAGRRPKRERLTVAALTERYLDLHARPTKRTWRQDETRINAELLPAWGDALATEITRQDVITLIDEIARRAPVQANRVRALISRIYSWAISRGMLEHNPASGTEAPHPERPNRTVLSDDELARAWEVLTAEESAAARIYRIFLLTGAREAAVRELHGSEVEGSWATVPPARMKGAEPWRLYLTPLVRDALGTPGPGGYYFASSWSHDRVAPISSLSTAHRRLRVATGISTLGHRTLRRTVATGMGRLAVPPHVIDEVLAHRPKSVARRHYNLYAYDAEKRDAWLAWEGHVRKVVGLDVGRPVVVPIRG